MLAKIKSPPEEFGWPYYSTVEQMMEFNFKTTQLKSSNVENNIDVFA